MGSIYVAVYDTQALASKSASWEHGAVAHHHHLCGEKSRSRIRWVKIFPRKVLPGSSGDEHVGFFRRIDRLQYGLQKIRGPTIWKLLWQLGQQRITCRRDLFSRPHTITSRGRDVHRYFFSWADGLDRGIGARLLL
jgi:hypothetical protein